MSLVSSYVLFDNGRWYRDPTIRGEDWYLCFDDDDPPEVVIKTVEGQSKGYYSSLMINKCIQLNEQGLRLHMTEAGPIAYRFFTDNIRDMEYAASWFVEIKSKIPASFAPIQGGTGYQPDNQGCFYFPGWTQEEVLRLDRAFRLWLERGAADARGRLPKVPLNELHGIGKSLETTGKISQADPSEKVGEAIVVEYERTRKKVP